MAGANPFSDQFLTPILKLQRGSRYNAYANLRESKLRAKTATKTPPLPPKNIKSFTVSTPPLQKSQLKNPTNRRKGSSSVLTQSVPDFSSVLRKENRKPALPPIVEKSATPPAKGSSRLYEINAKLIGSKSSEKRGGGGMLTARRSCANVDELKKFSLAAANAINGENRRGGGRSTGLGYRQFY
ncbi:hypothetical protein CTI12_AA128400 [Artemisia annua]|uniref:Uncharacterized protein n=1 Tax=Artemisia annua TaxID=35608 RepID=A0A2U1PPE7_ARTAN|nr:hypothetical protein CTI12_AA128400 [Artemisia annua]